MAMNGTVSVVTGASRGIGKGIAMALAKQGSTVYITGRTTTSSENSPGSMDQAAAEINESAKGGGGKCIAVVCDHADDKSTEAVFDRVAKEQNGRLDVLVCNAYSGLTTLFDTMGKSFWEKDISNYDAHCNVGLRSNYTCGVYGARMMVNRGQGGLIMHVSAAGGIGYSLKEPCFGIAKAGIDRMANDMAHELRKHNVAVVSLWPGQVKTELAIKAMPKRASNPDAESPEFAGLACIALATNPQAAMQRTGKILLTTELARDLGFTDITGKIPASFTGDPPGQTCRDQMAKPPAYWDLNAPTGVAKM